jgi:hypothetical protein
MNMFEIVAATIILSVVARCVYGYKSLTSDKVDRLDFNKNDLMWYFVTSGTTAILKYSLSLLVWQYFGGWYALAALNVLTVVQGILLMDQIKADSKGNLVNKLYGRSLLSWKIEISLR